MKFKDYLLNILSPPRCVGCNERLELNSEALFCYECSQGYCKNNGAVCEICGKPIYENRDKTCAECKTEKRYYIKNISRYRYEKSIKIAIQNIKFKRRMWIAFKLGNALYETVKEGYSDINFDMILYVPMTPLSEFNRGFNQSYEMADIIAEKLNVPINHKILYKRTGVKTQSGLNRKERAENVKNAFYVRNSHLLTDKTILLIDDVFTTGSTINACAKILRKNGALAVYTATLATTDN